MHSCHTRPVRVSSKLALGLATTASLLIGSFGYRQIRKEQADLQDEAERNLELLGTAIQGAIQNALRDGKRADIQASLDDLERKDPTLDIYVLDRSGRLIANSWGGGTNLPLAHRAVEAVGPSTSPMLRFEGTAGFDTLTGVLPLRLDDGEPAGVLVLIRPLDSLRRDFVDEVVSTVAALIALGASISAVAWLLIILFVRHPLGRLVTGMRAVRCGDLRASVAVATRDEVGDVLQEFNHMLAELDAAKGRLVAEVEARRALEAGLQRADKLVTIGQLAAGLAHEIGSPLQIVSGRARSLAAKSDLSPEQRRNVSILIEQTDRVARIVEQLLDFARRRAPRLQDVDVRAAGRAVVDLVAIDARRRGVQLSFEAADALPPVIADADQVQQLILNLLTNALHATPNGGHVRVTLAPSSFPSPIDGAVRRSVSIVVEDTGAGMSEEALARAFEPFFTTREDGGGTGLGLAIVKSIVTEHGGTVAVRSAVGSGTCFTVELPVRGVELGKGLVA